MSIRKTRRQLVMDAGAIAALYAASYGPKLTPPVAEAAPPPAPTAAPDPQAAKPAAHLDRPAADDLVARLAYLTGLVARLAFEAERGDECAADRLASVNRCLDLPIDCLDGTFARRVFGAKAVA
jgi:hypothetical protein